jgi:hypothetical protein
MHADLSFEVRSKASMVALTVKTSVMTADLNAERWPVTNFSDEETDEPLVADHRNFYKAEKWSKDGQQVERIASDQCVRSVSML